MAGSRPRVLVRAGEPDLVVPLECVEQRSLVRWAAREARRRPALELLHAIPNGGGREVVEAKLLQGEGVRAGVPDLCLPWPTATGHGLYVEMKRRGFGIQTRFGTISADQLTWLARLNAAGVVARVCRGSDHAKATILAHLDGDTDALTELDAWWRALDVARFTAVPAKRRRRRASRKAVPC